MYGLISQHRPAPTQMAGGDQSEKGTQQPGSPGGLLRVLPGLALLGRAAGGGGAKELLLCLRCSKRHLLL